MPYTSLTGLNELPDGQGMGPLSTTQQRLYRSRLSSQFSGLVRETCLPGEKKVFDSMKKRDKIVSNSNIDQVRPILLVGFSLVVIASSITLNI